MNDAEPLGCGAPMDIFTDRVESAYFLTAPERVLVTFLDQHLNRGCAATPSRTAHQLTTLYFDTEDHALARRFGSVRLRMREYGEADPSSLDRPESLLWIELKVRTGNHTHKQRFAVPSERLDDVLNGGLAGLTNEHLPDAKHLFCQLGRSLDELRPSCATRYRRQAWQDRVGSLRITLDTELGFSRAPIGRSGSSLNETIVAPAGVLGLELVEIKHQRELPRWLTEMIPGRLNLAHVDGRPFSKFLTATRVIHGPLQPTA